MYSSPGINGFIALQINNGTTYEQKSYLKQGTYIEKLGEAPFSSTNMTDNGSRKMVGLVGDGYGSELLSNVYKNK